ncbi:dynein regulatory complex subunit 4 [Lates calcarifer]|uniref:Dynein regulatory complex subunit 4 n=1 Tax=Lates calcarifer TaxID=8187 RepID=A0A4W6FLV6_LATCA|nr:dynein regulatory complex subunit 4 [Lates calcarifer]
MPPKTKSKKKAEKSKSPAVVDGLSTEEMSKDQLEEHIIRLREELDREQEERRHFLLERDKIQTTWEVAKRNLEEVKDQLRNRRREREEAKGCHRVEISKLNQVLSEQHNTVSELKMNDVASASLAQNQHTELELGLQRNIHGLEADCREKRLQNQNCIKELKLKHQVKLMELMNDCIRRIREMEVEYHMKTQLTIKEEDKRRKMEVDELDKRMKSRVTALVQENSRALKEVEDIYCTDQNRMLKEELSEVQRQYARVDRVLSAAQQKNKRLRESLPEEEQNLLKLQKQPEAKNKMAALRARVTVMEKKRRDLTVKYELLLQACEKVQQERDELQRKQTEAILDLQQRSDMKELLLERKLTTLTETLEKKEAQLCAVLSASAADQTARSSTTKKLEEILETKQVTISTLKEELARDSKEYEDLLQTCRERLKALGVPQHDFPFRPAKQILNTPPPKH